MMISGFIGLGYGPFMKAATYQMDEGVKQGAACCQHRRQITRTTRTTANYIYQTAIKIVVCW